MMKFLFSTMFLFVLSLMANPGIATGSHSGTYIQIGHDIAKTCEESISLDVFESKGSMENFYRTIKDPVKNTFIMTQFDLLKYMEANHNPNVTKIKMVYPLYNEEFHLLVRADMKIKRLRELNARKVVVGTGQSGTWLTSSLLQKEGHLKWIAIRDGADEGIRKLLDGKVHAVIMIAGIPTKTLLDIPAEAASKIRLVSISDPVLDKLYGNNKSVIPAGTYPFQKEDVRTYAIKSIIASYDHPRGSSGYNNIKALYHCLQDNIENLRHSGHKKWQEVDFVNRSKVDWPLHSAVQEARKAQ